MCDCDEKQEPDLRTISALLSDLNDDGRIDFLDFAVLANEGGA
ncbi:MAG: hypothetical protein ACYSWR_01130 [Planctomycetota bacterium]